MRKKLATVSSGGGTRCSYGVGCFLALGEVYGLKEPDLLITGSGGTGTASYVVSGQYDSIRNIWCNLLSNKKFLNPWRFWKIIDIDYLIDRVFKEQDPLDAERVYSSSIEYQIAATNSRTGSIRYFSNHENLDIFELMRASKAMPLAYGKTVELNGEQYCDSYASSSLGSNLLRAVEQGAEKVIIIDNDPVNLLNQFLFNLWLLSRNREFRENYGRNIRASKSFKFPSGIEYVLLSPQRKLSVGSLDNNSERLRETINQGYRETASNRQLQSFLSRI